MLFVLMFSALTVSTVKADPVVGAFIFGIGISEFSHSKYNTPLPACFHKPSTWVKADGGNYYTLRTACDMKK